ncbi:sialate O-acetylesterase [Runella sp. MFBS21]|uniref:sialate O-acetylesterase n=1 Tax=Runella sp. MFBS21 TaxID=3034018 RepID=UPI0023F7EF62|nr:sialate O-acetylesterase [Runella sp. MFBS21]MDF7819049.1 sialate O-acetylesterase [Runella sp. MFBS21]
MINFQKPLKNKRLFVPFFLFAALLFAQATSFAQVNITFPLSRIVFQRSNANTATFVVSGTYQQGIPERIEASLVPMVAGQGTETGWQLLEANPIGGIFSGTVTGQGGWYKLKVRIIRNGQVAEQTETERIGIGEVFVVAGQSNARGLQNYGAPSANDDRVNCFNFLNASFEINELPEPSFAHLNSDSYIAPYGYSAWSWGKLGDMLTNRLNVPILFFNAALEGTTSRAWRESTTGWATNPYIGGTYTNQLPYSQLRVTIKQYASLTGIRAVLWHQGEADTQFFLSEGEIVSNLQQVVSQSRNDSGHDISWMIAKVSYNARTESAVINAQNRVIQTTHNVFEGPATDNLQVPRPDGVHIQGQALSTLAELWNASLTQDFFNRSQPQAPVPIPMVKIGCADNGQVKLTVQGNFSSYSWNTGWNEHIFNTGPGSYRLKARDAAGNFLFSPTINISNTTFEALPKPSQPTVIAKSNLVICAGEKAELAVQDASGFRWSNGATSQNIFIGDNQAYRVQIKDQNGCWSDFSAGVSAVVNPVPEVPTVVAKGPLDFCADASVELEVQGATSQATNRSIEWSSGQKTGSITVSTSGQYAVRAMNQYNCYSAYSAPLRVTVHPLPATPSIMASGPLRFCEGETVTLSVNTPLTTIWNDKASSQQLKVTTSGSYQARTRDALGCTSLPSSEVKVEVNPIPARPQITKYSTFTLEATGEYLPNIQFKWTYGDKNTITTDNLLKAVDAGKYSVTAFYYIDDTHICTSPVSDDYQYVLESSGSQIAIYPNPSTDGTFAVECLNAIENANIYVVDATGKVIFHQYLPSFTKSQPIKVTDLPSGFYILKISGSRFPAVTQKLWVIR